MLVDDIPTLQVCCGGERLGKKENTVVSFTYHLLDSMKGFPMKTKGLFKQDFIFHSPLIWEGGKVGQISQ